MNQKFQSHRGQEGVHMGDLRNPIPGQRVLKFN
jgi:hypothetical protein